MRAEEARWPWRPKHITNDGESCRDENLKQLTEIGIIPNEHLQGIQTSICGDLGYPTLIVEFPPDPKKKPVHIDSRLVSDYGMRPACGKLRKCTDNKLCHKCDNLHANLFRDLTTLSLASVIKEKLKEDAYLSELRDDAYIQNYLSDPDRDIYLNRIKSRCYLEYDCWLLGLREFVFPIIFEGKVIAVFFTGQICLNWKLDFIKRRQREFSSVNADCFFDKHFNGSNHLTRNSKKEVLDIYEKWFEENKDRIILSEDGYTKLLEKVCNEIGKLEETLLDQMSMRRNRYVRKRTERLIKKFRDNLPGSEGSNVDKWNKLWLNTEERLAGLCEVFNIKYIVAFANKSFAKDKVLLLDVVVKTGSLPKKLSESIASGQLKFNLGKLTKEVRNQWITSEENSRIFSALEGWSDYCGETNLIRVFPVPFFPQASLVILVGYYESNPLTSEENKASTYSGMAHPINSFYTLVLSTLSSVLADAAEKSMESALRIFGHETGQLTAGLDGVRTVYLSNSEKLRGLSKEKASQVCEDTKGYVHQLILLSRQAKILLSIELVRKELFSPYKELIPKWNSTYRLEKKRKNLEFYIVKPRQNNLYGTEIYGDKDLLEQLLYNLINNAVKYSYRGTKIKLECKGFTLTVTDYGRKMECTNVYGLYQRGANVAGIEGLGIGMFLARQITEAHKGIISHSNRWISNFNVPLIEPYLNSRILRNDAPLMKKLREELHRLKRSGSFVDVVALGRKGGQSYYNPTRGELVNSINKKTWEVTFSVEISTKE
jgi:signal transduction histidine kinase